MGLVEGILFGAPALGLIDGPAHGGRDLVGIHDHHALRVSGRAADGLDEGGLAAEKALLVCVQNGHQAHLRQVQSLPQQVDAHQHVKCAQAQVADDLHALDGVDVVVHVADLDACVFQVIGQVLRHLFGEGGDQYPLGVLGALVDLPNQVVDLPLHRAHLDPWVQQACGPDDLLHDLPRAGAFVLAGRGGDVDHLMEPLFKLLKFQRPVVEGAGQAEAVVHQGRLAGAVAVVHGPHLRQGHVGLVNEKHKISGEIIQQSVGGRAHRAALDDPGVILDPGAVAQLLHHLHVVHGALLDALGLDELVVGLEKSHPLLQLPVDLLNGGVHFFLGRDVVRGGPDGDVLQTADGRAGDHVDLADAVDLVPEELHPDGGVLPVGGKDLHRVPPDPEHVALKGDVVAFVADGDELFQQFIPLH